MSILRAMALGCSLVVILSAIDARAAVLRPGDVVVVGYNSLTRVDPGTGDRMLLSGPSRGTGVAIYEPQDIALGPDGKIYVAEPSLNSVIRIDPASGNREIVSESPTLDSAAIVGSGPAFRDPTGLAFEKSGQLLVVNKDALYRVDPASGNRTIVSSSSDLATEIGAGIALDKAGNAYISSFWGNYVPKVNTIDGDRSGNIGDLKIGQWARLSGLAISDSGTLFAIGDGTIYAVDPLTGRARSMVNTGNQQPTQVAIDGRGNILAGQGDTLYAVNPTNANIDIRSGVNRGEGWPLTSVIGILVVPIPEPSTLVHAGMGLMTLLALAINRRKTR